MTPQETDRTQSTRGLQQTRESYRLRFLMKSGFSKQSDSKFQRVIFGSFSRVCCKFKKKGYLCSLEKVFCCLVWKYSRKASQFDEQAAFWIPFSGVKFDVANRSWFEFNLKPKGSKVLKTVSISHMEYRDSIRFGVRRSITYLFNICRSLSLPRNGG